MINCRSIPPAVWGHAHDALVFYFSRRHGLHNAEDLAQDTLAAVLTRDDFEFEKEEDFLRVCYGFASRISQSGYRVARKHAAAVLDPNMSHAPARTVSLNQAEMTVLLDEVLRTAKARLSEQDWDLIQQTMSSDRDPASRSNIPETNNIRVRLHRARRKLAKLTGWRK